MVNARHSADRGGPAARAKLIAWLHHHHADVLVAQEAWKPVHRTAINLVGYRAVGGDGDLFCWSVERFTIERQRLGRCSRFRCDLALVPDYLIPMVNVRYDHSTRAGEQAFTDRSGILIDVPVTLGAVTAEDQDTLFTLIFVLNVLPDPWQRIQALRDAARFARPGGFLLVVTRSPANIDSRAARASWPSHQDGYWSSEARGQCH